MAPNILNDYDQATYHLKLFLAKADLVLNRSGSLEEWYDEGVFSDDNIIVIAESGVTSGLYIESFSVTDIVTLSPQFNSSGVAGKMVIKEPLGANFIDYYNGAIDQLGYETRIQAPVFLEITFRGYDENGNYLNIDAIGNKLYRFMTKNIEASFISSGTQYDIDYVVLADIARQMAIANTSNNITVQGSKVKDFFDKLTEEWNKAGKDVEQDETQPPAPTTGATGAVPSGNGDQSTLPATEDEEKPTPTEKNEFFIVVDDSCVEYKDCLSWEVGKAASPDRLRTANTSFNDGSGPGTIEATWGPGSSRVGILLDILYSTKNSQTLIVNGKQDDEVKPGSKELGGTSYLPEIDVQVEQAEYNGETHTYNKKITYIIQERRTTQITPTPKEVNEASNNEQALVNKLQYVRRRYDYFGTGKNTEILEFNIKINSDFLINLPAYNAQKRTSVADNPGTGTPEIQSKQVADGNKTQLAEGVKKPTPIDPDQKTSPDPTNGAKTSTTNQTSDISVNLTSSSILNGPTSKTNSLFDTSFGIDANLSAQIASYSSLSNPLDSLTLTSTLAPLDFTSQVKPTGTLKYGANFDFLSSITSNPVARANDTASMGKRYLEDFSRIKADSPRGDVGLYRATISTDISNRGGYNLDDTSGIGKSYVTALLSGMYGQKANMSSVAMDVRGDPLWLGVRNKATRDQAGSQIIKGKDGNPLPPSDHKILLTVVFPNQYDENTGLAIPNKLSEGYTAFYNLKTVTSSFENGKFTQKLEMYQDLSTEQVRKYIDPAGSADI